MTHVTIAGGGLAGLSAALRLAERGYRVSLYESKSALGGNVASRHVGERVWLDVYPHMYLNWYHNFWALLADVTDADREQRPEVVVPGEVHVRIDVEPHALADVARGDVPAQHVLALVELDPVPALGEPEGRAQAGQSAAGNRDVRHRAATG